jgi:hypothetical protein
VTTKIGIGIFKAIDKPIGFFECDSKSVIKALTEGVSKIIPNHTLEDPTEDGIKAKKVGEIRLVIVEDESEYLLKTSTTVKVDRTPEGEAGTWDIQSVIFSKADFDLAECKTFLTEKDGVGDHGSDETDTAYIFRQYEPKHFSEFKTITLAPGVSAVNGKIAGEVEVDEDEAEKAMTSSIEVHEAIKTLNKKIGKTLKMIPGSCTINKTEDEESDDVVEERLVMSLVLEPNDGNDGAPLKPDTQDDIYSADSVRKTAHGWMENYGAVDFMHNWKAIGKDGVRILESFVAPVDFELGGYSVIKGTWMLALRIANDDLWEAVKNGDIGAYSIGGTATRTPIGEENA